MEQGSLLYDALSHTATQDTDDGGGLQNTLVLDAFCLPPSLERLAAIAQRWNEELLRTIDEYPWLAGIPPQFGLHCTSPSSASTTTPTTELHQQNNSTPIVHLRAQCVYGASVADEWKAILLVIGLTRDEDEVVVSCWDLDDGQVVLIQAAEVLPSWVDAIGPEACRHRCWIQKGSIRLLEPKEGDTDCTNQNVSLSAALQRLVEESPSATATAANTRIRTVIQASADAHTATNAWHKTVALVPEATARLLERNSGLLHRCIQQLHQTSTKQHENNAPPHSDASYETLVWLPLRLGRTAFAMLMTSAAHLPLQPEQQQQHLPSHLKDVFTCGNTLHYAVRKLLQERQTTSKPVDRRETWRVFVEQKAGMTRKEQHSVLASACPIFDAELRRPQIILNDNSGSPASTYTTLSNPPGPELVDSTDWMAFPTATGTSSPNDIDQMLAGVHSFLQGQSIATEGVECRQLDSSQVLRLLHTALHSTIDELRLHLQRESDPFFTQSDYDLMEPDAEDDSNSDSDDDGEFGIADAMDAMDEELRQSKPVASTELEGSVDVLSNLMRSLEASGGSAGPVQSLLSQAGQATPRVLPEEDESDE